MARTKKPSPDMLNKLQEMVSSYKRGYRSNELLDQVRPKVHPKQQWFLQMDHREVLYGGAAGGGKALALDTPIPTPTGWTTMGAIQVGDQVLDDFGRPTIVIAATDVMLNHDVYKVQFSDGTSIYADADHRWMTQTDSERQQETRTSEKFKARRRTTRQRTGTGKRPDLVIRNQQRLVNVSRKPSNGIRTTLELSRSNFTKGHSVHISQPLKLKPSVLPIDPYILGLWLGDGNSASGRFTTADSAIVKAFQQAGFYPKKSPNQKYAYGTRGLSPLLRRNNLLNNKHVPPAYLRGSIEQRLSLLQGLMDTDGNCTETGAAEFTSTNQKLADAVQELVCSLGGRGSVSRGIAKLNGKTIGPKWRVKFVLSLPIFRLSRKLARQRKPTIRAKRRYITAVTKVKTRPVRCIQVANERGMFLAGRSMIPTHNSDALLMAALQYIDIPGYAALLIRRTYADLAKSGALMDRANQWLSRTVMKKRDSGKKWEFPGGGVLEFGFLDTDDDKYKYQSAEYQFVGYDELTQFPEGYYTYLFSRLRKPAKHCPECFISADDAAENPPRRNCRFCLGSGVNPLHFVPLRFRGATNPGGVYGEWVKDHYIPSNYLKAEEAVQFGHIWTKSGRCILCYGQKLIEVRGIMTKCIGCDGTGMTQRYFIPARLEDNASIDLMSYELNLASLDEKERAQLRHGRWDFMSDGTLFRREWIRRYGWRGDHIELYNPEGKRLIGRTEYTVFMTADTASKVKTSNDPTVICVWALHAATGSLCLLEVHRERMLIPDILPKILQLRERWNAQFIIIEEASSGIAIIQEIQHTPRGRSFTVMPFSPHTGDKVARSQVAQIRMKSGQIYFPETSDPMVATCINEMLLFFDPDVHDDFVDNLSMASWYASGEWRNKSSGIPGSRIRRGVVPPISRFRIY